MGVALRPEREGDSPIVCVRLSLCQRGLPYRVCPGGGGMFASGTGAGLRVCAGCASGACQVCGA